MGTKVEQKKKKTKVRPSSDKTQDFGWKTSRALESFRIKTSPQTKARRIFEIIWSK